MKYQIKGNYYAGDYHAAPTSGRDSVDTKITKYSPADLSNLLWECPIDYKVIDKIIDSANIGQKTWRKVSTQERINYLKKYQEEALAIKDQIAEAIALETGKPLWEAMTEASAVISKVDVTINDALKRIDDKNYPNLTPGTDGHVYHKPIGVCFIIGPFNFPCHLANGQMTSALIAGNSVIFKPSEKTAYSAQLLIDCFHRAGFPEGVINLVQGDGEIVRRIIKEKSIKGVLFTGSKEVGKLILENTSNDLSKLVALELGGKNLSVIHKDAPLNHTLREVLQASFMTSGQRCTSTGLVAIHRSIHQEFISKFHDLAKKIIIDHPIDHEQEPFMGPLVDQNSVDKYLLYMGMAKREGIEEVMRGKSIDKSHKGYYVSPSIHLTDAFSKTSHFLTSEIFGPNCTFVVYDDIDEAFQISKDLEYGLAASIFTNDNAIQEAALDELEAGLININRSTAGAHSKLPFGGIKNSGNHRPAAISTIDYCVYPLSSLHVKEVDDVVGEIKGLQQD